MTDPAGVDMARAVVAGPAEKYATGIRNCRAETSANQLPLMITLCQAGKCGPTDAGSEYRKSTKYQDSLRIEHRRARSEGDRRRDAPTLPRKRWTRSGLFLL